MLADEVHLDGLVFGEMYLFFRWDSEILVGSPIYK